MEAYLILSQAVAVLKVLLIRVDQRLTLLEDCQDMENDKRTEIQKKLLSTKEDILYSLKYTEGIVSYLRDGISK